MAEAVEVIAHWHHSVEGLSTSSLDFYAALERALAEKEVPDLRLARTVVNERGLLSSRREYLAVHYGRLTFDVCGAPFGKDFFFSWWLTNRSPNVSALLGLAVVMGLPVITLALVGSLGFVKGLLAAFVAIAGGGLVAKSTLGDGWIVVEDSILAVPVVGHAYRRFVTPTTYYSEDTRQMFEDTVHRTVVQVVEGILTVNKMPPIPADHLRPRPRGAGA